MPESIAAQDLAGKSILFEIGARAGVLDLIESSQKVTAPCLSQQLNLRVDFVKSYLEILASLSLLSKDEKGSDGETSFFKTALYEVEKNKAGYFAWGMISCAPLIQNTQLFASDFDTAVHRYPRSGEHVARTSRWIGEQDYYPYVEEIVAKLRPKKIIDLGSGTCGLLIRLAKKISELSGIGIDISEEACNKAIINIKEQSLSHRIEVMVSPIQNLVKKPGIFLDADVVHAGFVLHDLLPDEEEILDGLLSSMITSNPETTLIIVDAIPFCENPHERAFSSAFSFLHQYFMGRNLVPEFVWKNKLNQAGFNHVEVRSIGISGGRIFVARKI